MTKALTKEQKAANKKAQAAKRKAKKNLLKKTVNDPVDKTPGGSVPVIKNPDDLQGAPKTLKEHMAALMYYDVIKDLDKEAPGLPGSQPSFEKIPKEVAAIYIEEAEKILVIFSKLNLIILKKDDPKLASSGDRLKDQMHIEKVILEFMKNLNVRKSGKHKTTQKLINPAFFPAGELAFKIVDAPYES